MAQLAFGVGGAVIGSFFGPLGTSIGFAIGSALGAYLFRPDGPTFEGPRLSDLTAPGGAEGTGIAWVRGTMRVKCPVIWSTDIIETRHEEEVEAEGGKGGGPPSATQVTYTYSVSFACSVCDGYPNGITGIRRIWADSKLLWSIGDGATPETFAANTERGTIRVYPGTESQTPDPLLAATIGADDCPAFRGTGYVVFDTLQLADFANHRPIIEAEVVVAGTPTYPVHIKAETSYDWTRIAIDRKRTKILLAETNITAGDWLWRWSGGSDNPVRFAQYQPDTVASAQVTCIGLNEALDELVVFQNPSPVANGVILTRFDAATGAYLGRAHVIPIGLGTSGATESLRFSVGWHYDRVNSCFWTLGDGDGSGEAFLVRAVPAAGHAAIQSAVNLGLVIAAPLNHTPLVDGDGVVWLCGGDYLVRTGATPEVFAIGATIVPAKAFLWTARGEVWVPRGVSHGTLGWRVFNIAAETWSNSVDLGLGTWTVSYTIGIENDVGQAWFGGGAMPPDWATLRSTDGTEMASHNQNTVGGSSWFYAPGVIIAEQSVTDVRSFFERSLAVAGVPLDDLVDDISTLAGAPSLDAGSLSSDTVRGYLRARPMTARGALEPLMGAFSFDSVEHDGELTYVKRGGAVAATLTDADIVTPVTINRALESELPATIYLLYSNQDLDYNIGVARARRQVTEANNVIQVEFPIAFNSEEGHQAVDRIMRYAWLERERFEFSVRPRWRVLEPTDVVVLPDGQRVRLTRVEYTSNGPVKCQAVSDDDGALTSYAVGNGTETGTGVQIGANGPTTGIVLDLPLLVDSHDDEGLYVAATGESDDWSGAVIFYSRDGGASWQGAAPTSSSARIGAVVSGKMRAGPVGSAWDHESVITVRLVHPSATVSAPASLEAFYNGANAMAISSDGENWEIVQAYSVTGNADGTYTLKDFLRGRKGTERVAQPWQAGAKVVFLEEGPIKRVRFPFAAMDTDSLWKAVGFGSNLADAAEDPETFDAVSAMPYTPTAIGGAKQASSSDFQLFATRRARKDHEWRNSVDVPLDEPLEQYTLEVWDEGFSLLGREVTGLLTPAYTYTSAMQTTDFGGSQTRIGTKWRQVSDRVGDGFAGEAIVGTPREAFQFDATMVNADWTRGEQPLMRLTRTGSSNIWAGSNFTAAFGRWYWELLLEGTVTSDIFAGITSNNPPSGAQSSSANRLWRGNGSLTSDGAGLTGVAGPAALTGTYNVVRFAWDARAGRLWIGKNDSWGDANPDDQLAYQFTHTAGATWRPVIVSGSDGSSYSATLLKSGSLQYGAPAGFTPIA